MQENVHQHKQRAALAAQAFLLSSFQNSGLPNEGK